MSAPGDEPTRPRVAAPGRRVAHAVLEAKAQAGALLEDARRHSAELVRGAAAEAAELRAAAREEGRSEGLAEAAALALSLRAREAAADQAALTRTLSLARLLAERLIGAALTVSDAAAVELARSALGEARGARRVTLRAHPADAGALQAATARFDVEGRLHAIVADDTLGRGDFVLETEVGTVEARLGAGLDRLAARLAEALRS